jgi:flagellar export protein FliJ
VFRFRFEALLTRARHNEEVRQKELAAASRLLAARQAALRDARGALRACRRAWRQRQDRPFRPIEIQLHLARMDDLAAAMAERQRQAAAAERELAARREALIEAMQKRKTLEKLREKDQRVYAMKAAERERKFIDEVAGRGAARRA